MRTQSWLGADSRARYTWHDHLDAGPEAVHEEESFVIIVITVILRNQVGDAVFYPGFKRLDV